VQWLGRFLRATRLDELPQLWNIFRGDMSFVGPRPERPEFVARYVQDIQGYGERFRVRPGLTGYAQVNGEYHTSPTTKLKYDLATAPAGASDTELRQRFANLKGPMMELSKCKDFVVNRGHYFGTAEFNQQDGLSADEKAFGTEPELSDQDKRALIAFLKTF
jgi:hypothetical protein